MTAVVPERFRMARIRRRLHVTTALALILAAPLGTLPSSGLAQAVSGGTLGIDCDKPRRTAEGKLVLDGAGDAHRAICEADRATALHYAGVVRETRDRLRAALAVLPPPVWDDLVDHLRTDDNIANWTYADPDIMSRLGTLSASAPPGDRDEVATSERAQGLAQHWDGGILEGSGVGADWQGWVRARACGFGAGGEILPGAMILVWLDPAVVRDRWTPEMVQRTARTWLESQSDRFVAVDQIPDVLSVARTLSRADGRVRDIANDPAVQACFATVPAGALAMRMTLWRQMVTGRRAVACANANEVGLRRLVWARQNGVFIVPEVAVLANGNPHPDRGEPLLGQRPDLPLVSMEPDDTTAVPQDGEFLEANTCRTPRTVDAVRVDDCDAEINGQAVQGAHVVRLRFREVQNDPVEPLRIDLVPVGPDPLDPANPLGVIAPPGPHPIWETTTLFCDGALPPRFVNEIPDIPEWTVWTAPSCNAQWGGRFDQGSRTGYLQRETYPPGWPVDEVEVRRIDDDCFNPVAASGTQSRWLANCPAGQVGRIREERDFSWYNRDWAVPLRHAGGAEGDRSLGAAAGAYDADPSQAGLEWYDVVTLVNDWHVVATLCVTPGSGSDDDDPDAPVIGGYDVDGDGEGDFANEEDARTYHEYFGGPGTSVESVENCGDCIEHGGSQRPPGRPDNTDGGDGGDDGGDDEGCFLTTAVAGRRGEADDGPTLTALRDFRDGWLAARPEGRALIAEYYETAPRIVAAIPRDHPEWDWIADRVDRAVAEIAAGRPESALETYRGMVLRLAGRWLATDDAPSRPSPAAPPRAASTAALSRRIQTMKSSTILAVGIAVTALTACAKDTGGTPRDEYDPASLPQTVAEAKAIIERSRGRKYFEDPPGNVRAEDMAALFGDTVFVLHQGRPFASSSAPPDGIAIVFIGADGRYVWCKPVKDGGTRTREHRWAAQERVRGPGLTPIFNPNADRPPNRGGLSPLYDAASGETIMYTRNDGVWWDWNVGHLQERLPASTWTVCPDFPSAEEIGAGVNARQTATTYPELVAQDPGRRIRRPDLVTANPVEPAR